MAVNFDTPFITKPNTNYTLSMYTLVNCPNLGCNLANDRISVQIKEGTNGFYREVYVVKERSRDDRWIRDQFDFVASKDRLNVIKSIIFLKKFFN